MSELSSRSLPRIPCALALLLAAATGGCVMTTFEGPGEPPRVAPPPALPNARSPAKGEEFGENFAEAPAQNEDKVRARHLLVPYTGSKRARSSVRRTREEAQARATEALERAKAGEDFAALVREYSEEPGAAERGGDLGRFDRRMVVKEFGDAAFALDVGAVSPVVETEFGFHVIQRTE